MKYEKAFNDGSDINKKSIRKGKFGLIEDKVLLFINEMTDKGVPVTEQIIRLKASEAAEQEQVTGFKASNGWISNFMRRKGIAVQVKHGDATSVSQVTINDWIAKLDLLLKDFDEDDIFNADQLGLFYSLLPSKTHAVKGRSRCFCRGICLS